MKRGKRNRSEIESDCTIYAALIIGLIQFFHYFNYDRGKKQCTQFLIIHIKTLFEIDILTMKMRFCCTDLYDVWPTQENGIKELIKKMRFVFLDRFDQRKKREFSRDFIRNECRLWAVKCLNLRNLGSHDKSHEIRWKLSETMDKQS